MKSFEELTDLQIRIKEQLQENATLLLKELDNEHLSGFLISKYTHELSKLAKTFQKEFRI